MTERPPEPIVWTLERYFSAPEGEDLRQFIDTLQADVDVFGVELNGAAQSGAGLPARLLAQEQIEARLQHLSSYLYCVQSADPGNAAAAAALTAEVRIRSAFDASASRVTTVLGALPEEAFEQLCADAALVGLEWRLRRQRADAASRLAPSEERLAGALLVDSLHGWSRLADATFQTLTFEAEGRDHVPRRVSFTERYDYFWDAEAEVRRSAYRGCKDALASVETVLAACLNGMTGARVAMLRHRGQDVIDEVVSRMAIGRTTLEAMMAVLHERRDVLQRYLVLKRQALGLAELQVPDRWAPLGRSPQLNPAEALDEVCDGFARAFPPLAEATRVIRAGRWIDFNPGPDKSGSGFCVDSSLADEPRVYLNVTGSLMGRTVAAHEIGHAFHFMAMEGLRPWRRFVPMTLAETASICAEHLYRSGMLARSDISPGQRLEILGSDLDAAVNYLLRIPRDYDFERAIYAERAAGELTAGRLKALSRQTHRHWFDDVFAPDGDDYAWTTPLLYSTYSNFFNFPYAFGYLLSRRIADIVGEGGEAAAKAYTEFLRATGSMTAEDAAWTTLRVDLTDKDFWHEAFDGLEQRIDAFAQATASPTNP